MRRLRIALGLFLPFAFLASCYVGVKARTVEVAVTPTMKTLPNGMSLQFVATARLSDGSRRDITSTATWSTSDTAVAVFDAPATRGLVHARAVGSVTITARETTDGVSGSTTLTVSAAVLTSIAVTPPTPVNPRGTSRQFTATGMLSDGTTFDVTNAVDWSSSAPGIALLGNAPGIKGLAACVGTGSATITATDPGTSVAGSTTMTVTPAELVSLAVTPPSVSIALGTEKQFLATGTYTDNSTQNLTAAVNWSSSDVGVATVGNAAGSKGLATSAATGSTTIRATDPATNIAATATLTVTPAVLVSLAVTPPNPSIALGTEKQFTATGTYTDHTTQDLTSTVTWISSATSVAAISNAANSLGLATSIAMGSTSISATDPATSISGSTTLTVTPAALVSLAVTPANPSIALGTAKQFAATGTYTDHTTQDLTAAVTWSSAATSVATISNANGSQGLATSAAVGDTTITATEPGTSIAGGTVLTVTPAELVSLAVTPANPSIPLGTAQQFVATGTYTDNTTQDLTATVTWSSADTGVATVSNANGSQGLASSAAMGGAAITATYPGSSIAGGTTLTVTPAALVSLAVTPASPSIALGTVQQFTATGTFTDSTTQDLTAAVTWSSADAVVATISNANGSRGLASSAAIGSTSITATEPGTGIAASTTLAVTPAVLVSLAVTPSSPLIVVGATQQFSAVGTYTDNSTQNLTTAVTWSAAATSVATISNAAGSQGLASGAAAGTTTITATDPGTGVAGSAAIEVVNQVTFIAASSNGVGASVSTLTIATPPGTAAGDVMIASISVRPNPTVTAPAGWTLVRRTNNGAGTPSSLVVYWRLATASEPASHTWTFGSSTGSAGGISSFRFVDPVTPFDVENGQATPDSLSHATPSVDTTVANTMIVTTHAYASASSWTPPAGMTEVYDVRSQAVLGGGGMTICGCWVRQAAAGATGVKTAVAASSQDTGNTHILALRRAP